MAVIGSVWWLKKSEREGYGAVCRETKEQRPSHKLKLACRMMDMKKAAAGAMTTCAVWRVCRVENERTNQSADEESAGNTATTDVEDGSCTRPGEREEAMVT